MCMMCLLHVLRVFFKCGCGPTWCKHQNSAVPSTRARLAIKSSRPGPYVIVVRALLHVAYGLLAARASSLFGFTDNHAPAFHIRQDDEAENPRMEPCGIVMMFSLADYFSFFGWHGTSCRHFLSLSILGPPKTNKLQLGDRRLPIGLLMSIYDLR